MRGTLSVADRKRVSDISRHLATLHLDRDRSAFDDILQDVRQCIDTDNVLLYGMSEQLEGWRVTRWHASGNADLIRRRLTQLVESSNLDHVDPSDPRQMWISTGGVVFYNPRVPHPKMRNRLVVSTQLMGLQAWTESRTCREVLAPYGMERHDHYRALLCDGSELLGWFGTLTAGALDARQTAVLRALIFPVRERLLLERTLDFGTLTYEAISVLLDAIQRPALLIAEPSTILEANEPAKCLLRRDRREVRERIAARELGGVRITQVSARGIRNLALAIFAESSDAERIAAVTNAAVHRWKLTPRQSDVLRLVLDGKTNADIATDLQISMRTVELHLTALFDRAGVDNRAALVARALTS